MRRLRKMMLLLLGVLVLLAGVISYAAVRMILHPYRVGGITSVEGRRFPDGITCRIIRLNPEKGVILTGFVMEGRGKPSRPTVIMIHGLSNTKDSYFGAAEGLCRQGYRVVAFDSREHGASFGGACTYGWKEKGDISAIIDEIRKWDADGPIAVYGNSMGGAIALQAMASDKRIRCGVIESTFPDFKEVACLRAESLVGMRLDPIVRGLVSLSAIPGGWKPDEVRPEIAVRSISQPVLLTHGTEDEVIPLALGERNFTHLASAEKEWLPVTGGHHWGLGEVYGPGYQRKIRDFLKRWLAPSASPPTAR